MINSIFMNVVLLGLFFLSYMIAEWLKQNFEVDNIIPLDVGDAKITAMEK